MQYILSHKQQVITFLVSVVLSVLLVAFYTFGASLIDTDSVGVGTTTVGSGLYVAEGFASVLSDELYVYGRVNLPFLVSTSTTASSFAGSLGVGTTTPGGTTFGVNEGWATVLSGETYVYGPLNVPFVNATSTTATSTLSNANFDSNTLIVDPSDRVAIATSTFGSINDETMTVQIGKAAASTTVYIGGSVAMLILRTIDGGDCVAISFEQTTTAVGANAPMTAEFITCPVE
ncbi:MAG: hypothetical protein A3I24_02640 [Candidatus Harrisonbacteria bacterium RIFCSPLOWO2_02_FULL_41_13b]|uniref:Uncharacterized protein n=1 Tax=Candidatus Harrisonbacteria bacterium RIFCSPLOWO2_02_FULL_41_13b TaxID=1798409 RepID=A0A1G1ZRH1_9BACT|nr:MAG: hypothetical protein A3J53_00410 [Candidatus Harrisonbacteria bacterium RIFCSPHIGHO2_02_FULL_40_20]OGY67055.1 MAG: hypothetical protein A3I24_02640 [Candidatus Harrisonbacteria bacterium RIFCSPLOWO2_02_FULL_41_13b]